MFKLYERCQCPGRTRAAAVIKWRYSNAMFLAPGRIVWEISTPAQSSRASKQVRGRQK